MNKQDLALLSGIGSVLFAMWLASNPRCNRGCRTMAEHLLEHGIDEFVAGLFA
jgi:hypothetical protein